MGFSSATPAKSPLGRERGDLGGLGHMYGYCCGETVFNNQRIFNIFSSKNV